MNREGGIDEQHWKTEYIVNIYEYIERENIDL